MIIFEYVFRKHLAEYVTVAHSFWLSFEHYPPLLWVELIQEIFQFYWQKKKFLQSSNKFWLILCTSMVLSIWHSGIKICEYKCITHLLELPTCLNENFGHNNFCASSFQLLCSCFPLRWSLIPKEGLLLFIPMQESSVHLQTGIWRV